MGRTLGLVQQTVVRSALQADMVEGMQVLLSFEFPAGLLYGAVVLQKLALLTCNKVAGGACSFQCAG